MNSIKVCDAIMGSGKSSAAITYMNEHRDQKFIYITPYLDEADRIKASCPSLHFATPKRNVPGTGFSKTGHIAKLLEDGRNVASTHKAFEYFTDEMLETISEKDYVLFIDESLSGVEMFRYHIDDLEVLVRAGYVKTDGQRYVLIDGNYAGALYKDTFRTLRSRELISYTDESNNQTLAYWTLPPKLLLSFKDVFVLTYLFEGQDIHHMLKMYDLPYQHIGVVIDRDGVYRFSEEATHIPNYAGDICNFIHILDNPKLNAIGDGYYDLSLTWYEKRPDDVEQVKKNLSNYFRNVTGDDTSSQRMWGSYKDYAAALRGKGYTTKQVIFNERATNKYRDRTILAYPVNVFMNTGLKNFYAKYGVDASNDVYALSVMVQWIWRSAIRDGKEIYLYLPSSRMRKLLVDWMESVRLQYEQWRASQPEGGEQVA